MQFKALLSKPGTFFSNTDNDIDYIILYPSFSSFRMGRIYILPHPFPDKNPILTIAFLKYAERLLAQSGVVRLLIRLPKSNPDDIMTSQGYQKDPFIYYTKNLHPNMHIPAPCPKEIAFKYIDTISPGIVSLFTQYRMFYQQLADSTQSAIYLTERLQNKESLIVEATYKNSPVGFVQLYPDFSISERAYTLNDLFVEPSYRNLGVAANLMKYIEHDLHQKDITKISLKTAPDNPARKLYERLHYKEEVQHNYYYKDLTNLPAADNSIITGLEPLNLSHSPQITLYKLPAKE